MGLEIPVQPAVALGATSRQLVRWAYGDGSRERGFGSLKYERLFLEQIRDGIELQGAAEVYRIEYNKVRPYEHLSWNRPTTSTPA